MFERSRWLREVRARDRQLSAADLLRRQFPGLVGADEPVDAGFVSSREAIVLGAAGLPFFAPVLLPLLADEDVFRFLSPYWRGGQSVLVQQGRQGPVVSVALKTPQPARIKLPSEIAARIAGVFETVPGWPGRLNAQGHMILDPRSPSPGPHFATNLLLGNRVGFLRPLQTTPKSVVDQLGRGSFRAHSAAQVLATRWDLRPEENGFPANRQCYLVEDGRQIFYSAAPADSNIAYVETLHAQNHTTITYRTRCGLEVTRAIFLLAQEEGLPLATEVQAITVVNHGDETRNLRLVLTGMFGPAAPNALWEDVVYTTVSLEARVLRNTAGDVVAISPHYHPRWTKGDERFHTLIVHQDGRTSFPTEFGTSYNEFVGEGSLERPQGLRLLSNRLARKGPAFFAVSSSITLAPGGRARADSFTCLVSDRGDPRFDEDTLLAQAQALADRYSSPDAVPGALARNISFFDRFRAHLAIESGDEAFDAFVNYNLPFQILYQTFVSRSFDQTQKGYREIGFREIQDLFAAMGFFIAMGQQMFVRDLLKEWAGQVYEFGYANHNFYWEGKEAGDFSDDQLWFIQAVDRYLRLTGDDAFLDERSPVAGDAAITRTIYETVKAIIRYSGQISVGKHGLPLLDRADWNDTLRLDPSYLNGPQKEAAHRAQVARGARSDSALDTDNSESVMNAFLLKIAVDAARRFAQRRGDEPYGRHLAGMAERLHGILQRDAWKGDFFARVLINRAGAHAYLGAKGDGLSADPAIDGTYFLNSFTWSILANVATEAQIRTMLEVVERVLRTPYGLKLCSPVNFASVTSRGGSAEYFAGDRENGGVFKHADMMAATAMLRAARSITSDALARRLRDLAYEVIDVVLPYRTMADPYVLAGNPRFCTQYNNSETGENVGPTLSGTAPWLWLALNEAFGLAVEPGGIAVDPLLRDRQRHLELRLRTGRACYHFVVDKPSGFCRGQQVRMVVDGNAAQGRVVPNFDDGQWHRVDVTLR